MTDSFCYLRLDRISKQFGPFLANDNISMSVKAGSIHAVLGENGAGKSTLMNILCGLYQPTSGQIFLNDQPVQISSPNVAIAQGIGMIHQHFMLVPQLSVVENIILGTEVSVHLNLAEKGRAIAQLADAYGLPIDPLAMVGELPVGTQQRVEILKALYRQAQLLILDEPTAVLTPLEIEQFFKVLRQLAAHNHTILFISHKLDEVMSLCDEVTVLRRGQVVATTPIQATTPHQLAELMVGRDVILQRQKLDRPPAEVVLAVDHLQVRDDRQIPVVQDVSFQLRAGEILGVAGVAGNGQRELADAIAGLRRPSQGTIWLKGQDITQVPLRQRDRQLRLGYIPEDRQKMGLVMPFSLARNLILKAFKQMPFCRRWVLQTEAIATHASITMQQFDIRAVSPALPVSHLSGGNQQKVVLARELAGQPDLIIAMQPTRGLDVGATESVQTALLAERERGAAILYISTELEEMMTMSDRIAVMFESRFVAILDAKVATLEQLGYLMAGGAPPSQPG